jgi:hypothetical protein
MISPPNRCQCVNPDTDNQRDADVPLRAVRLADPLESGGAAADTALGGQVDDQPIGGLPDKDAARLQASRAALGAIGVVHRRPSAAELHGDAGTHAAERVDAVTQGGALGAEQVPSALDDHGRTTSTSLPITAASVAWGARSHP